MKEYQSKFRENRASKGDRAKADDLQAKPTEGRQEGLMEEVAPGVSSAREVHITHDHAAGRHHVHVIGEQGEEAHSDHATAEEAHMTGAQASGIDMSNEGNYAAKHKNKSVDPNSAADAESEPEDDFEPNVE